MHYVTIVRDSRFVGCLAGPFDSTEEARKWVEPARELAIAIDDRAWFDSFGVTHVRGRTTPGSLNERLGVGEPTPALPPLNPVYGIRDYATEARSA